MFCPSCGKKIPDHSTFCLACGRAIQVIAKEWPPASPGKRTGRPFGIFSTILVLVVLAVGVLIYLKSSAVREAGRPADSASLFQTPSRPPEPVYIDKTESLFTGQLVVRPGQMLWKRFKIDALRMRGVHVVGTFRASGGGGNDIQAVLIDEDDFENWKNGHPAKALYGTDKVTVGDVDTPIRISGTYIFCFSNKFSAVTEKQVYPEIELIKQARSR